jgi:amino acid transporter
MENRGLKLLIVGAVIIVIQAPLIVSALVSKSHFTGDWALIHSWAMALVIESLVLGLSYLRYNKQAFAMMTVSSLFVLGYFFDGGIQWDITNSAIILLSFSLPFINYSLGQKEIVPKPVVHLGTEHKIQPEIKPENDLPVPSNLSLQMVAMKEAGHSLREIQTETNIPKTTVARMIKSAIEYREAS